MRLVPTASNQNAVADNGLRLVSSKAQFSKMYIVYCVASWLPSSRPAGLVPTVSESTHKAATLVVYATSLPAIVTDYIMSFLLGKRLDNPHCQLNCYQDIIYDPEVILRT